MYRVSYRQRATDAWSHRDGLGRAEAYALKRRYRAKLWAAFVQIKAADGTWIDA